MFLIRDLVSPRTWLAMTQHLTGFFVGIAGFVMAIFGFSLGVGLLPLALVGVPVLGVTLRFADGFARFERFRLRVLLGLHIPAWPTGARAGYRLGILPKAHMVKDRAAWLELGYAVLRMPVSLATMAVSMAMWSVGFVMLALPFYNQYLPAGGVAFGDTVLKGDPIRLVAGIGGFLLLLAAAQVTRGLAVVDGLTAKNVLGPPSDLAARVTELTKSREMVVDAAEAERRRIERDLHDGAQQRLVALAMELGRAKAKFADDLDSAKLLIDEAHTQAKEALTELRNLVRGVHPPVLTDRGLDAALSGLIALCPVPVDLHVDVPVRPKSTVEAVAYFVVAEALTNIAKHSRASHAKVVVEGHGYPGTLTVMISDDGIGGADPNGGGLSGLAGRVSGVDGRLTVESPEGGPTIIAVELPCG